MGAKVQRVPEIPESAKVLEAKVKSELVRLSAIADACDEEVARLEQKMGRQRVAAASDMEVSKPRVSSIDGIAASAAQAALPNGVDERLRETEAQLSASQAARIEAVRMLQDVIGSLQLVGESLPLDPSNSENPSTLRREMQERRWRGEEIRRCRDSWQEASEATASFLKAHEQTVKEKEEISRMVEGCIEKLEKETSERPHLCDKRLVTQMLASYLEQQGNPRQQLEICSKMADVLGFSMSERQQVGLSQRAKANSEAVAGSFAEYLLGQSEGSRVV